MLPNESRPGRNSSEMDHPLPPMASPLDRKIFESSCNEMTTPTFVKRSKSYDDRTTASFPLLFENYRCETSACSVTENRSDNDVVVVDSVSIRRNVFRDENTSPTTCNTTNNAFTCNCRNSDNRRRNLFTNSEENNCNVSPNVRSTNWKRFDDCSERSRSSTRNRLLGNRGFLVFTVLLIGLISACSGDSYQCAAGIKTPGQTWPHGDIVLEYGQSLSILCMLNMTITKTAFPGKNSSDLVFIRNKKEIEPEYIHIVNETAIEMYVEKPPPAEDMYYCKLRLGDGHSPQDEPVCLNKVVIGFKPQEPKNFSCISYNWENMICSWDPVPNYVRTRFTLVFKLPGRAGGRKLYPCPTEDKELIKPNTCRWDASTNPIYRQPYESYTFIMNVANVLGNISVQYKFHHFAHVIPAKPANLSVVNKTTDSALLHWSVPFPMQNFPSGLHHRVTFQQQWDHDRTWQVINITNDIHESKRYYNLTGLEYANTVYDVRIFMKSAVAIGEDKWSNFSDVTFRTLPRLPGLPPRTDIGSFEIADNNANRDVYLYWQTIPLCLENGDNFKYQIAQVEDNGRKVYLQPNETTKTYAKFKGIGFNKIRFEVVTTNVVGPNPNGARIVVPSRSEMPPEPLAFTKIAFDGGLYELSWKPPLNNANVTNYTIFWCNNDRDRPYQCTGYLDWVHVSRNTTIYNMTTNPKMVYQFAISANTETLSSGMVWASCTVIHNKVVGKMKSVWINTINSDFIEVGWKLECSDRIGIVEGFNIYYCPIVSPYNLDCIKGSKRKTTIRADPHTIQGCVYGLKPYTTYSITVTVLTKNGEGLPSDPLYNTTLEGPPTTPLDVRVTNVTNTTMLVSWNPPIAMNGVLRYYEVHYNGKSLKVDEANHVILKDLTSHRNYSVSVAACTVSCSVRSPALLRITDVGVPGKIGKIPNVRFMNSSQVVVRWAAPNNPGGFVDYYQIWSADGEIRNSTKNEAYLPIADCKTVGRETMYQFRVRAINLASDGTHLIGPWSEPGEGNCYSDGPSYQVWVIIWIISCLSGLAFVFCIAYTSKRMWLKCKAMQDVEVKLPPGLAPNMKLLQKVGEQHMRQTSADSSGCSSGQESVTSSLTSNSHVSSDSGADVDPVNPPGNKLLDAPPTWEASRLRQRNVSGTRPIVPTPTETPRWDSYVKVAKIGDDRPIIVDDALSLARSTPNLTDSTGYTASPQAWSSTGYISMPSSEELSSNPSPVPEQSTNPTGYSVVGVAPKRLLKKSEEHGEPTKMPYVSLASLERKPKDGKSVGSIDFDDLTFVDSGVDNFNTAALEIASKPYVQTGLMDSSTNKSFAAATTDRTDVRRPFASAFSNSRTFKPNVQTDPGASKPYVAVGAISEVAGKIPARADGSKQKMTSEIANKANVTAATAFPMLQPHREKDLRASSTIGDGDVDSSLPPPYSMCWPDARPLNPTDRENIDKSTGSTKRGPIYVTVGENPRRDAQSATATNPPYVHHQRLDKTLPTQQTSSTTTDEQYSKVSVAPDAPQ